MTSCKFLFPGNKKSCSISGERIQKIYEIPDLVIRQLLFGIGMNMKTMIRSALLIFPVLGAGLTSFSAMGASPGGEIRDVSAMFLFSPEGFDDNDGAQLVIDGYLPDDCHRVLPPAVSVDFTSYSINVQPQARFFAVDCDLFQIPFSQVIDLGALPKGQWRVKSPGIEDQTLTITEATNAGPDDHLYVPLDGVHVSVRPDLQKITATLAGRFTNTCMMWETIQIVDTGDTVQLLPIMRMQNRPDCRPRLTYFDDVTVEIPWRGPGRYLLHSRSLNGQAVNTMFSVYGEGR